MTIHKRTRLLPGDRQAIFNKYHQDQRDVASLSREYRVSRVTIYKVLRQARLGVLVPVKSINRRFRTVQYGLKRLAKIEMKLQAKLKARARRYGKSYPGEMVHVDCARLPLLRGESRTSHRYEYLFVGIDDYSRELFAAILPDKTAASARSFLDQMVEECAYTIDCLYSDNGREFRGDPTVHAFVQGCLGYQIPQAFTKVKHPQTNGKAERVIRTLRELWHDKEVFRSRAQRKQSLNRFINWYNTVKPHAGLNGQTPLEILIEYFFKEQYVNNA